MNEDLKLPQNLISFVGKESRDFVVTSTRAQPLVKSIGSILFGTFCSSITSIFSLFIFYPLWEGKEIHIEFNGDPITASMENLEPLLFPGLFLAFLIIVGLGFMGSGIYSLFQEGGIFVGTPTRLVNYRKGQIHSTDWQQFSGNIETWGNGGEGNLAFEMRHLPNPLYMIGIKNVLDVEKACRKRISENDPSPNTV